MIKDEYSPYKIVHHPEFIAKLKNGESTYPLQVHLVVTNVCNQGCSFCAYRTEGYSSSEDFNIKDVIPKQRALDLIDELSDCGIKALQFTGGGEPLAHPNIDEIFQRAIDRKLEISLVSNGVLLNEKKVELLKDSSWVRVSLDAGSEKTYSDLRKTPTISYSRVLKNLEMLVRHKSKDCVVGIGFVVTKENHHEIYEACKIAKDLGVNNFRVSASMTPEGLDYFRDFKEAAKSMSANAKLELESSDFTVFNLFDDRISNLFDGVQDYDFCPMKEAVVYVGADLGVYTCCVRSYNHLGFIDSLKNKTFKDLWEGLTKKNFYKYHSPKTHCKIPCMFEGKNEFMNYCIKKDAKHVDFI